MMQNGLDHAPVSLHIYSHSLTRTTILYQHIIYILLVELTSPTSVIDTALLFGALHCGLAEFQYFRYIW